MTEETAFPQTKTIGNLSVTEGGLSCRDYFAAKALQGLIAAGDSDTYEWSALAEMAYALADEMMKARQL